MARKTFTIELSRESLAALKELEAKWTPERLNAAVLSELGFQFVQQALMFLRSRGPHAGE